MSTCITIEEESLAVEDEYPLQLTIESEEIQVPSFKLFEEDVGSGLRSKAQEASLIQVYNRCIIVERVFVHVFYITTLLYFRKIYQMQRTKSATGSMNLPKRSSKIENEND